MKHLFTIPICALFLVDVFGQSCLVAFYPFTGNANDITGNGHDGVVMGPVLAVDRFGASDAAYQFDGVDDFIDLGNDPQIGRASSDFSVTAWIRLDDWSSVRATIIGNRDSSTDTTGSHIGVAGVNDTGPGYDDGELNISCVSPAVFCADSALTLGAWRHIGLTYDRVNEWVTLYYDGLPVAAGALPNFLEDPDVHHTLGLAFAEGPTIYPLFGRLDELALFDCALSDAEVLSIYNGELTTATNETARPSMLLFPNPAGDLLFIPVVVPGSVLRVFDATGREMPVVFRQSGQLDVSGLKSGPYLLRASSGKEFVQTWFHKL